MMLKIRQTSELRKAGLRPAFTLMEMVISISIITLVSALFIANYRSASKRTDLIMMAQNLAADIHLAQNNTLGLVKYNDDVPAGGWGIHFDKNLSSYTLFADLDAPGTATEPSPGYMQYDADTEGITRYGARVTQLPAGLEIASLKAANGVTHTQANVSFLPPDPQTNIYLPLASATSTSLEIEIRELRNNSTKKIFVNFLGLAEVQD